MALQPDAVMKARVKFLRLLALATSASTGVGHEPMSMYGATDSVLPVPPPPVPVGVGLGLVVRVGVGLAAVGVGEVAPPAEQDAPLSVQLVGAPDPPLTTQPN